MHNQQGPTVYLMELCLVLCGSLDGRGIWGSTCLCSAESLCYSPETITTFLIGYSPIQNVKLKKKKTFPTEIDCPLVQSVYFWTPISAWSPLCRAVGWAWSWLSPPPGWEPKSSESIHHPPLGILAFRVPQPWSPAPQILQRLEL